MNFRRRKSSDEVTIEVKDSKSEGKRYWNLRGEKEYNYQQDESAKRNPDDEINVEFNLNENRKLTEKQKQTILDTLLQKKPGNENNEELATSNKTIFLIILLTIIGTIATLGILSSGC